MKKSYPVFPEDWLKAITPFCSRQALDQIIDRIVSSSQIVYPPLGEIFRAFELTQFESVKVVILGQDPYHGVDEACGLCFAVKEGVKPPPSLKNLIKELSQDLGVSLKSTELVGWAKQGILLLNRTLTVFKDQPLSHKSWGWDEISFGCLKALILRRKPLVFLCLGKESLNLVRKLGVDHHPEVKVIEAPHPSPLSAHRGFFGSKIFSRINKALVLMELTEVRFQD